MKLSYTIDWDDVVKHRIETFFTSADYKRTLRMRFALYFALLYLISVLIYVSTDWALLAASFWVVGLPAACLLPHWMKKRYRAYFKRLYKAHGMPNGEAEMTITKKSVKVSGEGFMLDYDWMWIKGLEQKGHYYDIQLQGMAVLHVPKKALKLKKDKAAFENYFKGLPS